MSENRAAEGFVPWRISPGRDGTGLSKQPVLFMSWNDTHESVDEEISHRTKKRLSRDVQAGWSGVRNTSRKHKVVFCLCSESQRSRTLHIGEA